MKKILITLLLSALPILFSTAVAEAATPNPTLNSPVSNTTYDEIPISYVLPAAPLSGSEKIIFTGSTTYTLTLNNNPSPGTYSFTLNPKSVLANGKVSTIAPSGNMADGTYSVTFSYQDASGDAAATSTATNVTINTSSSGISLASVSPADNASSVSVNPTLTMTFNQPMVVGSGNLVVHKVSDGSIVESIPITGSNVSGGGTNAIAVSLPTALTNSTAYYVTLDSGALSNQTGSSFGGITAATTWQFSTVAPVTSSSTATSLGPDTGYGAPSSLNRTVIVLALAAIISTALGLLNRYGRSLKG